MSFLRLLLHRDHHWPDLVGADGYRTEIFRHGVRPDEQRFGFRRDRLAVGGRLRDRRDPQLVPAVHHVDRAALAGRLLRLPDASGTAVRGNQYGIADRAAAAGRVKAFAETTE